MSTRNLFFKSVTLRNFMSYGNVTTHINLDQSGTIQIQGRNLDDTQQGVGANGVGKSSIVNAIVYALYGEVIGSDVKIDDIVNDINKKECVVSVVFDLDEDEYTITRYRKMKSGPEGNYVDIFKNGKTQPEDNLAKATIPETNIWLEEVLIDMPKDLFTRLVVYDADEVSFFKLSAQKQRDLMESLFQLTILSEKASVIKDQQKESKLEVEKEENVIELYKSQISQYTSQIERATARVEEWEKSRTNDVDKYRSDFIELDNIDFEYQRSLLKTIADTDAEIEKLGVCIKEQENTKSTITTKLNNTMQQVNMQLDAIRLEYASKTQELSNKILLLDQSIQKEKQVILDQQQILTNLSNDAKNEQREVDAINAKISQYKASIQKHEEHIAILNKNECPECHQTLTNALDGIQKREMEIFSINTIIDGLTSDITKHECITDTIMDQYVVEKDKYKTLSTNNLIDDINKQKDELVTERATLVSLQHDAINEATVLSKDDIAKIRIELEECEEILNNLSLTRTALKYKSKPSDLIISCENQITRMETEKQSIETQIKTLQEMLNPHISAMQELIDLEPADIDYTNINHYKNMVDHQQFLIKMLTDKKSFIRKKLISKRLPYLNERLALYLKSMGLPYRVEFNSDLTPSITKRGSSKSFGVLSHGQKARVNFALSFAFRDILERMHRKINICLLDEVLDKALCSVGANAAVTLINEKAREDRISIFVITHKSELSSRFAKQLIVTLENGFSSVHFQAAPTE